MSTEVAERGPIDLTRVSEQIQSMLADLDSRASEGTAGIQLDIMDAVLSGASEEDIFKAANAGTQSGKGYEDPFLLHSWESRKSAPGYIAQGGFPFYLMCRITDIQTGERRVLVCGGFTFVSTVYALDKGGYLARAARSELGGYPLRLESRATQSGYDVVVPHPYRVTVPGKK